MALLIEIPEINYKKYLPQNFNECSPEDYKNFHRLLVGYNSRKLSFQEFQTLVVYAFVGIKPREKDLIESENKSYENIVRIAERLFDFSTNDGFYELTEENGKVELKMNQYLNKNPIPEFKIGAQTYKGYSGYFDDITFGQYLDALHYMGEYHQFNNIDSLIKLVTVFYRPLKFWFIGPIVEYKEEFQAEKEYQRFKYLDPGIIYGVYYAFSGFQIHLNDTSVNYNGQELDFSLLFKETEKFKSDIPGLGMKSLLYSMAETGTYGSIEQVRNTNNWEVLMKFYDSRKTYFDDQKRFNESKSNSNGK